MCRRTTMKWMGVSSRREALAVTLGAALCRNNDPVRRSVILGGYPESFRTMAFRSTTREDKISSRAWFQPLIKASGVRPVNGSDFAYRLCIRMHGFPDISLVKKNSISRTALGEFGLRKSP